jgi:hypothetical protein
MKTKQTLLVAGAVSAIMLSTPLVHAAGFSPLIVTHPSGSVRIQQALPCGTTLDTATRIAAGRIEVSPANLSERALFALTRLDLFLTPFSVRGACQGIEATADFSEVGLRLADAVTFSAELVGTLDQGQYRFTIPKDQFLIYESVLDNASPRQPDTAYQKPSEDVTGLIDLRNRTVQIHVVLATQLRFRAGCVGDKCVIDETDGGTQTADVVGSITPPTQDRDGDGIPDVADNCPRTANTSQALVATPVMKAPSDVTLTSCLDHTIVGSATAVDLCDERRVLITNNAPAQFAVGENLITWFGNDGVDPIVTAQQKVTVLDKTAPAVSCTVVVPQIKRFRVAGSDDCAGNVVLRLGRYTLANGEVIQFQDSAEPGVRLIGTADGIRRFSVGRGYAVINATDAAGNIANVVCQ